jgi:predicted anti-sigma-YlaC factor YlaD
MSQERVLLLRNALVAVCALAAIVVLASFYSIVNGAVERAARQRLAVAHTAVVTKTVLASQAVLVSRTPPRVALLARDGN